MTITYMEWLSSCITRGSANLESASRMYSNKTRAEVKATLASLGFTADPGNSKRMLRPVVDINEIQTLHHKNQTFVSDTAREAITSYVIGTQVHPKVWDLFLHYCHTKKYEPIVIPIKYKNPTSLNEAIAQEDDEMIDPRVRPFIITERYTHDAGTIIFADVRPQITAQNPLSGLEGLGKGWSGVVGHPTQQLISVPRMLPNPPCLMLTTGTVSDIEFGHHLAAKKAEFHSVYGWVVVEADSPHKVPLRHVQATSDGVCFDLGRAISVEDNTHQESVAFWGDSHFGQEDSVAHVWAEKISLVCGVSGVYLNDTFDGSTINHHEADPLKRKRIFGTVHEEVEYHNKAIGRLTDLFEEVFIMTSNHNNWVDRWVREIHPLQDLDNLQDRLLYARYLKEGKVLEGAVAQSGVEVNGYSLFHGHETCNGGKLSPKALSRIASKAAYGHTHSPIKFQGVVNPGCLCNLEQDYTKGSLTSWAHGVVLLYKGGKDQLLIKQ